MPEKFLHTPIEYLKGVGPQRAELLQKEAKIFTFADLLHYFPFRYVDRTQFHKIDQINTERSHVQVKGTLARVEEAKSKGGNRLIAYLEDDTGMVELVWFKGHRYIKPKLKQGEEFVAYGRPNLFNKKFNIPHPELSPVAEHEESLGNRIEPVYPSGEKLTNRGLHSKGIFKLQKTLLQELKGKIPEVLPTTLLEERNLMPREAAFWNIHVPQDHELLKKASDRLKFEELFFIQVQMGQQKVHHDKETKGFKFPEVGEQFNRFYKENLPFDLTNAQKRVLREIRQNVDAGKHMNRLLQGDVGSGKTLVALLSMLLAIDNGFQASMMAPTETLANQHYKTLTEMLEGMDVHVGLLTGSTPQSARTTIHKELESGQMNILVGTHALIEERVQFQNLGLTVIDEQHRFGVAQRAKLWKKNELPPHVLVMTATPIPRTLAMTLYGDLDVSVIDELPPGRKPVKTVHRYENSRLRVFGFLKEEIDKGRQAYIVYPLIEESSKSDYKNLMEGYEAVNRFFNDHKYQVSIVHGQMKPQDKDYEMQRFARGETQIMVATTVIEVGVDVPNASVMVIESTERFGLSQLHQLRGRVGRGADQAYCILMTGDKLSGDGKKRIGTMVETTDGFRIAEVDLQLRGPGDIAGTQQSGVVDLKISDIARDQNILQDARKAALRILEEDPFLMMPQNRPTAEQLDKLMKQQTNWSRIS